jgi:ParB family chromosome partitioning protein
MAALALTRALQAAGRRTEEEEAEVLRRFLAGQLDPLPARRRGAPRGGRRGRISLAVPVGPAGVRCTATDGKVELRADMDFSTLDRDRLETAIEAFFTALGTEAE